MSTDHRPGSAATRGRPATPQMADEDGAQMLEYAALGSASVTACGVLTLLLRSDRFAKLLDTLIQNIEGALGKLFG